MFKKDNFKILGLVGAFAMLTCPSVFSMQELQKPSGVTLKNLGQWIEFIKTYDFNEKVWNDSMSDTNDKNEKNVLNWITIDEIELLAQQACKTGAKPEIQQLRTDLLATLKDIPAAQIQLARQILTLNDSVIGQFLSVFYDILKNFGPIGSKSNTFLFCHLVNQLVALKGLDAIFPILNPRLTLNAEQQKVFDTSRKLIGEIIEVVLREKKSTDEDVQHFVTPEVIRYVSLLKTKYFDKY